MKKIILGIFLTSVTALSYGQQDPQFTQFFRTKLNYNPAFAGSGEAGRICAGLLFRSQWMGFGSADKGFSPQTYVGDIHGNVWGGRIGLGLNIANDEQGHERTLTPTFSFAYHHTFENRHKLSAGLGVGILQKSLDGAKLRPQQGSDPLIPQNMVNGNAIDMNFGLYYQIPAISIFNDVYAGFSATHLNQAEVQYGNMKYNASMHYYFMMGGVYLLTPAFTLEPNIFVKNAVKTSVDVNVMTTYNGRYMGGLTYRNVDAFAVLAGIKDLIRSKTAPGEGLSLLASYDITTSRLAQFSNGTVEITARYCFGLKVNSTPPPIRPILTPRFL